MMNRQTNLGMVKNSNNKTSHRVIGYISRSDEEIERLIEVGRLNEVIHSKGEFTIVYNVDNEIGIVTSYIGAMQYCYYYDGLRFAHGERVIDIVREMGLNWEWDMESVGDLCELENLTADRTLHKRIKKVPPGSFLKFDGKLTIHSTNLIDTLKQKDSGNAVDAVDIFNEETQRWCSRKPYLSLSGGFDSRVILSSMLKQNIFPTLVTLGNDESSDLQVASSIANTFGLEHIRVTIEIDELLQKGEYIAMITNGSKPACHWHTFLYPKKARVPKDESFFVGTLGEFARSYYFDMGFVALLLDSFPKDTNKLFWQAKLKRHRTFKEEELQSLTPDFRSQVNHVGVRSRALRNAILSKGDGLLMSGCRYYLEQRVPNFYANGIRMYNDTSQWRSPFHSIEWLSEVWSLGDNWKLGSNWHRLAIQRNLPSLLNFPEEKGLSKKRMLRKAPPFYWHKYGQRVKYRSYDLSEEWYTMPKLRQLVLDNKGALEFICEPKLVEKIMEEHSQSRNRTRAISLMLTIIFFKRAFANAK